jgi:hypothetical protein
MAAREKLCTRHVVELALLLFIAALCIYFLVSMLFYASPSGTPAIQEKSHIVELHPAWPANPLFPSGPYSGRKSVG